MIGIYIFKNIKEKKVYIGQSSRLEERKYEHYHPKKREKDQFHLDLRENPDDFEYKVLQECLVKELDTLESMWMNWYKNEGWELYNVCLKKMPNTRGKSFSMSEETRKKMSDSQKGKHRSIETRKKMSIAKKGNQNSKGVYRSEDYRRKMSESMKGNQNAKGKLKGKHLIINPETGKREWI